MSQTRRFSEAVLMDGFIVGELPADAFHPCFQGAWYYKVVSSCDMWLGMEGICTLPLFLPDESRKEIRKEPLLPSQEVVRYLDTPSVYVGGSSDYETDIVFGWFHGMIDGQMTPKKITFRPFWRTIYQESGKEMNVYLGTKLEQTQYYFFPGDKVKIQLLCEHDNELTFIATLLEETSIPEYRDYRAMCLHSQELKVSHIKAPGNGIRPSRYKRVNAIDQYHNEGKPTQITRAKAMYASWEEVYLYRNFSDKLIKVPFYPRRYTTMQCPTSLGFQVEHAENIEHIQITPQRVLEGKQE